MKRSAPIRPLHQAVPPKPVAVPPGRNMLAPSRARRAPSTGELARRRWAVRWGKRLLPATALGLLVVLVAWPEFERTEDRARMSFRRTTETRAEAMRVVRPNYRGLDDASRPYTVTARVGQQVGSADILDLELPRADVLLTDGAWVYLESNSGRYDKPADHLSLAGEVTLFHDNGTTLVTDRAEIELKAGTAEGDAPVAAQGPFGTLTSEGFRLTERGAVVVFTGRAHAVLEGGRR